MAQTDAERIHELESQVAQLQQELADQPAAGTPAKQKATRSGSRWRSFWSALLIVLACVLAPLSVVAVWAKSEITDTERYVATVAPLAEDPAIQQAVSERVTAEILTYVNIPELTQQAIGVISENRTLKPRQEAALNALGGALDSGLEGFIGEEVSNIVQSDLFSTAWTEANTKAHEKLNLVLSGDNTGPVAIEGNDVTLDVGQIVAQVKQSLIDRGFTVAENIPTVDSEMVIFQSENLSSLQRAYALLNTLGIVLPIVAAILGLLGIAVANDRRKAVLGVGIGLALSMLVSAALIAIGRAEYLNALPDGVSQAAATSFFDILVLYLKQTLWAGLAAAVVLILGALLTGPAKFAVGLRGLARKGAAAIQHQLYSWGATMTGLRTWVAHNAGGLRIGVTIIALIIVVFTRYKTVELVLWSTVGLLVALFVIQILASGVDEDERAAPATPQAA